MNRYSSYQSITAQSSAKFSLTLAVVLAIVVPILLCMSSRMDCKKSHYIPESLCDTNSHIRKGIFVIIISGIILHISSYMVNKSIEDSTPVNIAHQKEDLSENLAILGHICFIPIYTVIILLVLRIVTDISKKYY
jgi:hypothetical protein